MYRFEAICANTMYKFQKEFGNTVKKGKGKFGETNVQCTVYSVQLTGKFGNTMYTCINRTFEKHMFQ